MTRAKETLQNLQKGVKTWQPIVAKAGHDLETKQATRDNSYDSKKAESKAAKSFNFGEIKKGIELAKQVHDVGMRTLAAAQNIRTLVIGVQNVHRNQKPEEWMGKPAQCQTVLDGFAGATHEMGQSAEAKEQSLVEAFRDVLQRSRRSDGGCTGDLALEHFAKILNQIPGSTGMCFKLPARLEASGGVSRAAAVPTSLGDRKRYAGTQPDSTGQTLAAARQAWREGLMREAPCRISARCSMQPEIS